MKDSEILPLKRGLDLPGKDDRIRPAKCCRLGTVGLQNYNRPKIVELCTRIGKVEVELILGKNRLPDLLVVIESFNAEDLMTKIHFRSATVVGRANSKRMRPW